jgi:FG-GAP-like repeat
LQRRQLQHRQDRDRDELRKPHHGPVTGQPSTSGASTEEPLMRSNRHPRRFTAPAVVVATLVVLAVTAQPASATSLAFTQHRPALGFQPSDVRPGDVDGDGVTDLVLGGDPGGGVSVARGNGDGTFKAPFISPPVTWSNGKIGFAELAVGDVNADGRADVAVGPARIWLNSEVQVLLGRADGTLAAARTFPSSAKGTPDDIAIADLNRDGNGDLVMPVNGGSNGVWIVAGTTVSVLLSNGDGTFRAPVEFPAGRAPTQAAVADFNGDGKRDVVVTNNLNSSEPDTVSVLLGNGDGTLAAPLATPLFADSGPFNMVAADLNGDGRQDVAIAHQTGSISNGLASVLFGNGDGSFTPVPRFQVRNVGTQGPLLATADFNRDGLGDLVVPGLDVSLQKRAPYQFSDDVYNPQNPQGHPLGNGLFGLREVYATPSNGKVVAADFDRDGWSDIATIGQEGTTNVFTVLLNRTASLPPISLASLTLDAGTVPSNTPSGATVTLSAPAPPGGTVVELAATATQIKDLPGSAPTDPRGTVTVAGGQTSARFGFTPDTGTSTSPMTLTIIAQLRDVTKAAPITITPNPPPDFTLTASPASLTIVRGGASSSTAITIAPRGGFSNQVTLTTSAPPAGVSVTPAAPVTVSPDAGGTYPSTTLTFAATAKAALGSSTVVVTGTGGGISHFTTLTLQVQRK